MDKWEYGLLYSFLINRLNDRGVVESTHMATFSTTAAGRSAVVERPSGSILAVMDELGRDGWLIEWHGEEAAVTEWMHAQISGSEDWRIRTTGGYCRAMRRRLLAT